MEENKVKLVLDIFYTLNGQSKSIQDDLPFEDVAILVIKENGDYKTTKKSYRTQFHGKKERDIYDQQFKEQKMDVENLILELKADTKNKLPDFSTEAEGYSFSIDETATNELKNISDICFDIFKKPKDKSVTIRRLPDKVIPALKNAFIDLGKAIVKKRIIEEVKKGVLLNGEYKELIEFTSVPKACEYFRGEGNLEDEVDKIKQKVKERALIFDKENQLIEDWSVINARINAWKGHQEKKYS